VSRLDDLLASFPGALLAWGAHPRHDYPRPNDVLNFRFFSGVDYARLVAAEIFNIRAALVRNNHFICNSLELRNENTADDGPLYCRTLTRHTIVPSM